MAPFVFDTLGASKRLREAGMSEGVAEAVVSVFQHAAAMPDISHLATRDDFAQVRLEIANLHASINDTIRQQGWLLLGGVGVLLTLSNGMMKALG
ncbi:MAG: hypothetical protein Q8L66_13765 [Caulobacter sp.]|nr:hypothetical protein [Caulobacter sp.]